jgi:chloride channel protein, CIC family
VRDHAARDPVTLAADDTVDAARAYLRSPTVAVQHTGFPVVDATGELVGVVTRGELLEAGAGEAPLRGLLKRPALLIFEDSSLRADHLPTSAGTRAWS